MTHNKHMPSDMMPKASMLVIVVITFVYLLWVMPILGKGASRCEYGSEAEEHPYYHSKARNAIEVNVHCAVHFSHPCCM